MKNKYDIIWLDEVGSTNDAARRGIDSFDNLSVLSALSQTAGRGQRGNTWCSDPGQNLTFSIILKYDQFPGGGIQAFDQFAISEIASLSIIDLLAGYGIKAKIKWPNDIYVEDRKICGILIENSVRGEFLATSIIGIGLNINQRNFNVTEIRPTSVALETSREYIIADCLDDFMSLFRNYVSRYLHINGGLSKLRRLYLSQMWKLNERQEFVDLVSGDEFTGIIRGLSDIGLLLVENEKGELKEFAFKEIRYII